MEEELAKFRAQLKVKQEAASAKAPEQPDRAKSGSQSESNDTDSDAKPAALTKLRKRREPVQTPPMAASPPSSRIVVTDEPVVDEESCGRWTRLDVATLVLKLTLWCLLMTLFVVLEFGAVFFAISVFYVMFTNFRKRPRLRGELSAYSVFNPNVEAIDGSLTAQDLERQLTMGILPMH
uniref:Putative conserved plasma membrane protein ovary overexpressed n=1 Tax=Rhipicephalus microplus TaxID=6941 RepID=A0A6M2CTL1_RHIMP